ncbi:MAG: hypothetical protein JKX69_00935 [Rhodobacteraceae bacterium]|nr:hypothetical protein [Paracoccaceae bacterium]
MEKALLILVIIQGLIFVIWARCAFRALFAAQGFAKEISGSSFPGPFDFIKGVRSWLADPSTVKERWFFALSSVALIGVTIAVAATGGPSIGEVG